MTDTGHKYSMANFCGSSEKFMRESIDAYLSKFVYESPNGKPTIANIEVIIHFIRPPLHENNLNEKPHVYNQSLLNGLTGDKLTEKLHPLRWQLDRNYYRLVESKEVLKQ